MYTRPSQPRHRDAYEFVLFVFRFYEFSFGVNDDDDGDADYCEQPQL